MVSKGVKRFHGKVLVDAEAPTSLPLLQVDIDTANERLSGVGVSDPKRFTTCVLAVACKRMYGDDARVRFNRTNCYLSWEGSKTALRYEYSDEARATVERFDRGEKIESGAQIVLRPPALERKLDSMRKYHKAWKKRRDAGLTTTATGRKVTSSDPIAGRIRNGIFAR